MPAVDHFACALCHKQYPPSQRSAFCAQDGGALFVRYADESEWGRRKRPDNRTQSSPVHAGIWRYADVLPSRPGPHVSLGEGGTPLLGSRRSPGLLIKDEGAQPLRTTEARGLALAVAMAHAGGAHGVTLTGSPSECAAMAAYAAAYRLRAEVALPAGSEAADAALPALFGAVSGRQTGTPQAEAPPADLSLGSEPFRLEGLKSLGFELAEQLGWQMPAAIVYPHSEGSAGALALLKAFRELEQLGWAEGEAPRVFLAEPPGSALDAAAREAVETWGATVLRVEDDACAAALREWGAEEGVALSLPGAAAAAAYGQLCADGAIAAGDRTVLVNPRAASLDLRTIVNVTGVRREFLPSSLPVGGIITPV